MTSQPPGTAEANLLDLATSPMEESGSTETREARTAKLRVVHSPDRAAVGRVVALTFDEPLAIGRGTDDPRGVLLDTRLSRRHARFTFDAELRRFCVTDLASRNGTFVDGARIESTPLAPNSVVRLGESVLVFDEDTSAATLAAKVAQVAPGSLSLLILGETGSGKELLARQVHERSARPGPFVAVNCAGLPRETMAAELFGHTRGAFSGATRERLGLFRSAEGGTLLLDEIGDMPLELQPMLLRVLQERRVRPIGSDQETPVDVRVLAATHQDLHEKQALGEFRADLFARLAQFTLRVPPLRARRGELIELARQLAGSHGCALELSVEAAEALLLWSWPRNFRELDALLAAHAHSAPGVARLELDFLRATKPELFEVARAALDDAAAPDSSNTVDSARLGRTLREAGGNLTIAARKLGISRQKLYRWMRQAGFEAHSFRHKFVGSTPPESNDD